MIRAKLLNTSLHRISRANPIRRNPRSPDRIREARRGFARELIELRDDEAIGKAWCVDSLEESAVTSVTRAHDGQMRGRCQARQVFRRAEGQRPKSIPPFLPVRAQSNRLRML